MRLTWIALTLAVALFSASAQAADPPRAARLMKDAGNQFLAAKKYADAVDCYLQAVGISPAFAEAHYNLAVAFLKGYNAHRLALNHFRRYLSLTPDAADRKRVELLTSTLLARVEAESFEKGKVLGIVADRLLVAGGDMAKPGDSLEVTENGGSRCACLTADVVYPDCTLTQRIWDPAVLASLKPGLFAAIASAAR